MPVSNPIRVVVDGKKRRFKDMKSAAEAAGVPFMTFYMRVRMGMKPGDALKAPVRRYVRRTAVASLSPLG